MKRFLVPILAAIVSLVTICPPASASGALPLQLPPYLQLTESYLAMDFDAAQKVGAAMPSPSDLLLANQTYAFIQVTSSGIVFDQDGALKAGVSSSGVAQVQARPHQLQRHHRSGGLGSTP